MWGKKEKSFLKVLFSTKQCFVIPSGTCLSWKQIQCHSNSLNLYLRGQRKNRLKLNSFCPLIKVYRNESAFFFGCCKTLWTIPNKQLFIWGQTQITMFNGNVTGRKKHPNKRDVINEQPLLVYHYQDTNWHLPRVLFGNQFGRQIKLSR